MFPGRALLRGLTLLPIVLPPVVGGVALLAAFGRRGLVGQWLDSAFGVRLPFSAAGAALAETFVAMPFFVLTVEGALRSVDRRLEDAARTLGAGVLARLLERDAAAGAAVAAGRRRAVLGARARRVRRHHHLCRQLSGPHADAAAGGLCRCSKAVRRLASPSVSCSSRVSLAVLIVLRDRWVRAL